MLRVTLDRAAARMVLSVALVYSGLPTMQQLVSAAGGFSVVPELPICSYVAFDSTVTPDGAAGASFI